MTTTHWVSARRRGTRDERILPFDGVLTIGADDDCDWRLDADDADPGRVVLRLSGGRVRLEPGGATVLIGPDRPITERRSFRVPMKFEFAGHAFRVTAAPPEAPVRAGSSGAFERLVANGASVGAARVSAARSERGAGRWGRRLAVAGVAVAALGIGVVLLTPSSLKALESSSRPTPRPVLAGATPGATPAARGAAAFETAAAVDRIAERVSALIRAADFESTVSAVVDAGRVRVVGTAGPAEIDRLRRVIAKAARDDASLASVEVAVSPANAVELPPLDVVQIVGGPQPYVVLADGTTLEPGARHDGLTLVAIQGHRLILQGKRRIEYDW